MNQLLIAMCLGVTVSVASFASHSGGNKILARGSQAWFLSESGEHLVRGMVENKTITESGFSRMRIELTNSSSSEVAMRTNVGQMSDSCRMVTESSHHGTVLKKEVRCQKVPFESALRLTRGSDAWAVVEGLEHSLRLAVVTDANVLSSVKAGESVLNSDNSVDVTFGLKNGTEIHYRCLRQYYNQPSLTSLNCSVLH